MELPNVEIGHPVIFVDERRVHHSALVTCLHGTSCINLVHVSTNAQETDNYGRQIKRASSVQHKSQTEAPGNYWISMREHREGWAFCHREPFWNLDYGNRV